MCYMHRPSYCYRFYHPNYFDVHVTVHRDKFLIINQLDAPIFQIYFGIKLYMFRTVSLSIIRSFSLYTQKLYMSANLYDIYHSCVYSWWTKELSETCRVSFQNKFEKLVHLGGFIIRNLSRCAVTWTSKYVGGLKSSLPRP
jgi:hypothetical protein